MNKEKYLNQRNELIERGQNLINEGKFEEFNNVKTEIEKLDNNFEKFAAEQANLNAMKDNTKIINIQNKGVSVVGTSLGSTSNAADDDLFASLEYRKAFMNYVIKGESIPGEFLNVNENTKTSDVGTLIPTTLMEKIIEKIEATGMILPLVTRTAYKGGVSIPISTVKPVATWVAEGATSDKQKKATGSITFAYHKLRCAVSVSLEVATVTLPVFESVLINNVAEAMVKAMEQAIINGTGTGQPKGILKETPNADQALTFAKLDYDTLVSAEAALPLEYEEDAVWTMTKKSFMAFVGMKDTAGQPIARVNYGIGGKPERTLLGRTVILCNYLPSYAPATAVANTFAFLFNYKDYILNTNLQMGIKQYEDNDTEDQVTKAVTLVDGKVVDKNSLVTVTMKTP